jgi:hypothetical protein
VLPKSQGTIKEEAEVAPNGARTEGGRPSIGGIAEVDVWVVIAVLPGEMESLGLVVLENQPHRLGQLEDDFVGSPELTKVSNPLVGLHNNSAVVNVGYEDRVADPALKFLEEGGEAKGREDRGQGRALSHADTGRELGGQLFVPRVTSAPIDEVRPEERNHFWREPLLLEDGEEDIVIDGREELSEVKSDHASLEASPPSCADDVGEKAARILSGVLTNHLMQP